MIFSRSHASPVGPLKRRGGWWEADSVRICGYDRVAVQVLGGWWAPDPVASKTLAAIDERVKSVKSQIESELFHFFQEFTAAVEDADNASPEERLAPISSPADVWRHVTLSQVRVGETGSPGSICFTYRRAGCRPALVIVTADSKVSLEPR